MSDEDVFELVKHPIFQFERKDETYYGMRPTVSRLTSTLCCFGGPIVKITMPETKDKIVSAIRSTYKIGAVKRFKDCLDRFREEGFDLNTNQGFNELSRQVEALRQSKY